ncbi:MAG: hypothetical protein ACRDNY_07825, partial [Gaiellaceae bacterium]
MQVLLRRMVKKGGVARDGSVFSDALVPVGASLLLPVLVIVALELPAGAIERIAVPVLGQLTTVVRVPEALADPQGSQSMRGRTPVSGDPGHAAPNAGGAPPFPDAETSTPVVRVEADPVLGSEASSLPSFPEPSHPEVLDPDPGAPDPPPADPDPGRELEPPAPATAGDPGPDPSVPLGTGDEKPSSSDLGGPPAESEEAGSTSDEDAGADDPENDASNGPDG